MHKLAKGLKKKKKSKKGKKGAEEEEFDPEELERYRRERAEAQEKAAAAALEGGSGVAEEGEGEAKSDGAASGGAGSDEWQKFQALTAGVDSILKKTQGDLDRIKSTSFFQRKAPVEDEKHKQQKVAEAVEEQARNKAKRWVGFDKDGNPIEKDKESGDEEERGKDLEAGSRNKEGKKSFGVSEEGFVDVPDDEEDEDDSTEEDIFDTTYVDVLQKIEVQLAYIPESPTEEEIGDDPFDTSNADKVLKTVDKKGNKLVSLGNAVEVLSGRIDHVSTCKISRPRKPPRTHDLLLDEDFDEAENQGETNLTAGESLNVEKTLLDDDSDLPDIPIDLTNLPSVLPPPVRPTTPLANGHLGENTNQPTLDISEFEILKEKTILEEIPDLDDAEFDLTGPVDEPLHLEQADDPFGAKETGQVNFEAEIIEASFEAASFVNEEDPFDTTFAENILPGKTELKFIEKELEELPATADVSISLTDPAGLKRDYETGLLSSDPSSKVNIRKEFTASTENHDLLGGSCSDLTQLSDQPIQPAEELSYVDPFDTSAVSELPPGRTELKFLERELLGSEADRGPNNTSGSLDDDDFDPRKEETKAAPPPRPTSQPKPNFHVNFEDAEDESPVGFRGRKPSRPEVLGLGTGKSVNFELPTPSKRPDLLQTSDEEKSVASTKPLTPYYSQKSLEETLPEAQEIEESRDVDPFDTSFVGQVAPGKTELKLIESELLSKQEPSKLKHSLSDHNLNPRSGPEGGSESQKGRRRSDFGTGSISRPKSIKEPEASLIEEYEVSPKPPSVYEVNEAAHRKSSEIKRQESILDAEVEVDAKPLTPRVETRTIEDNIDDISYADPFDTSIATNILPGKAELKLLENELSELPAEPQQIRVNKIDLDRVSAKPATLEDEDDFDPRAGETDAKVTADFLSLDGQQGPADKVLTPLHNQEFLVDDDADPFDTSFASIGPGKTELKLLESELMDK